MARARLRFTLKDRAGNAVQNAAVNVYEPGTTDPVANMWTAKTAGVVLLNPLVSNGQGEIEAWLDGPQPVDLLVTDNGGTSHYPNQPTVHRSFTDFTENVDVYAAPDDVSVGAHPDLTAHDVLGLATQADLDGHATSIDHDGRYYTETETDTLLAGKQSTPILDVDVPATIARDTEVTSAIATHAGEADPHTGYQKESSKNAANGYAGLGGTSKIAQAQISEVMGLDHLTDVAIASVAAGHFIRYNGTTFVNVALVDGDIPATIARDSEVTSAISTHEGAADPHTEYQKESEKGSANGYAGLGADSLVPQDQLGTGVQDGTKFLRDDGSWQIVAGGTDDQIASEVPFTPAGGLVATDVQAALTELDTEKGTADLNKLTNSRLMVGGATAGRPLNWAWSSATNISAESVSDDGYHFTIATTSPRSLAQTTAVGSFAPGDILPIAFDIKASALSIVRANAKVQFKQSDGTNIGSEQVGALTAIGTDTVRVSMTTTPAPALTSKAVVSLRLENLAATSVDVIMTKAQAEIGSTASEYRMGVLAELQADAAALAAHTDDTADAHDASAISFVPAGTIAATTVQAAIEEVASEAVGGGADDQVASEVPFTPTGGIAATNVQTALAELDTEKATAAALTAHVDGATDVHDASAISILDTAADFTATDVEGALAELQSDHETDAAALTTHAAAADPHAGYQKESEKGAANGYASLGADTLVPQNQLGSGTQDGTKFLRDDGTWQTVAGGGTDDQIASEVPFTPAGSIASTNVQAALAELDASLNLGEAFNVKRDFGAVGDGIADDTVALQAAIDAAELVEGSILFPPGTYLTTAPLVVVASIRFIGSGRLGTIILNRDSDIFWWGCRDSNMEHMSLVSGSTGGGGHIFKTTGPVTHCMWFDLFCHQTNLGKSVYSHIEDAGNYLFNVWSHVKVNHAYSATVPSFDFVVSISDAAMNSNAWQYMEMLKTGNYGFWFESARSGNYVYDMTLRDVWWEAPEGGCVMVKGGNNPVIENHAIYDLPVSPSGAATKHLFHLGEGTHAISPALTRHPHLKNIKLIGGGLGTQQLIKFDTNKVSDPVVEMVRTGVTDSPSVDYGDCTVVERDCNVTRLNGANVIDIEAHLADASDAHDASAISYVGGTGMSAIDVEAAIDELATEKSNTTHTHTEAVVLTFSKSGVLATGTGTFRLYAPGGVTWTIAEVRASVGVQPTGASILVDVNKSGTTIFTTQSNRPTIAVSTNTDLADAINVTSLASGEYLTADIDQIGSTIAGSDLTVQVLLTRTI